MVPILYSAISHDISYLPNAQLRYLSVDEDYMALNKLDLSIYYPLINHDLLHFDVEDSWQRKYLFLGMHPKRYGYSEAADGIRGGCPWLMQW